MDKSNDYAPIIPLLASSLLNTLYLRILTTKSEPLDEQTWKAEWDVVMHQWRDMIPQLEKLYCNTTFDPSSVQKLKEKMTLCIADELQHLGIIHGSLNEESPDVKLKVAFHEMKIRFLQEMLEMVKNP